MKRQLQLVLVIDGYGDIFALPQIILFLISSSFFKISPGCRSSSVAILCCRSIGNVGYCSHKSPSITSCKIITNQIIGRKNKKSEASQIMRELVTLALGARHETLVFKSYPCLALPFVIGLELKKELHRLHQESMIKSA